VEAARFNTAASGVNYLSVTPSATTAAVQIATTGTDSNINLAIMPKGTGSVGIGTTSPISKLTINVSGAAAGAGIVVNGTYKPAIALIATGASGREYDLTSASGGSPIGAGNFAIYDRNGGGTRFVISPTGLVGIGTTSPAEKLEVSGNIKASGTLQVANSAATCTSAADYGKFRYNPVNGKLQICKP